MQGYRLVLTLVGHVSLQTDSYMDTKLVREECGNVTGTFKRYLIFCTHAQLYSRAFCPALCFVLLVWHALRWRRAVLSLCMYCVC